MKTSPTNLDKLAALTVIHGDDDSAAKQKRTMHRVGQLFLQTLADDLGLQKDTYRISSNKAGTAVSGEVILHGDKLFVQISDASSGDGVSILYRNCRGQKDSCGGQNHFISVKRLNEEDVYPRFVKNCQSLMAVVQPTPKATVRP